MPRIAIDAMGGDFAPRAIVGGALAAVEADSGVEIVLVGDESKITRELLASPAGEHSQSDARIRTIHTDEFIAMDDSPVEAVKSKPASSMAVAVDQAVCGEVDAVVSAGNTGAFAAVCQLKLRNLPNVVRAGIGVAIPTASGPVIVCDVGANIQAKAIHLEQYAVMASLYASTVLGLPRPRVALLSIGEEERKGNELTRQAHERLKANPSLAFVGNVEGGDLFDDRCDVAVCDGFVGNIVLKLAEGLAEGLLGSILSEVRSVDEALAPRIEAALIEVRRKHDYSEYGGAPLLGVSKPCFICHGRSNERAIGNAVLAASSFCRRELNDTMSRALAPAGAA